MEPWFKQGLKPLYDAAPLFCSSDRHEAKQGTTGAFKEHDLIWRDGKVDSVLRRLDIGELSVFLLRYGAAVHIAPGALKGFMLFQVPISGQAQIRVGTDTVLANPRTGVLISPTLPLVLDWDEGCEQLLLKIPRWRIEQVCAELLGTSLDQPVEFAPQISLSSSQGRAWQHLVSALMYYSTNVHPIMRHPGLRAHEEALIHHLLLYQSNNYAERLMRQPAAILRRVRVAEDYIREHLQESLTLNDIASASGSSVRSLSLAFQEHYRLSPMAYVRQQRLEQAHRELLKAAPGTRVTDIAFRWGFSHLGRFCAQYRDRYGRTPMQTLKR